MSFCFGCMQEANHATNCPKCGHGYLTCEGCTFCGYQMTKSNITLKVNPMPRAMLEYRWPCGETNCDKLAYMEFEITTLDSEYKMAICARHAQMLQQDLEQAIEEKKQ